MKTRSVVVLAVVALAVVAGLLFARVVRPRLEQAGLQQASDVTGAKGRITVAGDNYLGYWFLTAPEFRQRLLRRGYVMTWVNDSGNYADRHERLARGQYDAIVVPINSYLAHGAAHRFPAVVPAVISDSKGADAIVAYRDSLVGGEARDPTVNDLNKSGLRLCYTPDSPSSFLLNTAIAHFALDVLKAEASRVPSEGSEDALRRLRGRECDAAVLWEPDVSRALESPGVVAVFGSDQVSEMIVDVFAVRRQVIADNPDMVEALFRSYYEALSFYSSNRDQMVAEMTRTTDFKSAASLDKALGRVRWIDLEANCQDWLSGSSQGAQRGKLLSTIAGVTKVMVEVRDLPSDPLGGSPFQILNSTVLGKLCADAERQRAAIGATPVVPSFGPLDEAGWARLKLIGSMRVLPITFDASTASMTAEGAALVDQVAAELQANYPQYRVLVRGHTAPSGDEDANVALAQQRAGAVKSHLERVHGTDPNRLRAVGVGSKEPLPRLPDEGERAYRNRLARVEFVLLAQS